MKDTTPNFFEFPWRVSLSQSQELTSTSLKQSKFIQIVKGIPLDVFHPLASQFKKFGSLSSIVNLDELQNIRNFNRLAQSQRIAASAIINCSLTVLATFLGSFYFRSTIMAFCVMLMIALLWIGPRHFSSNPRFASILTANLIISLGTLAETYALGEPGNFHNPSLGFFVVLSSFSFYLDDGIMFLFPIVYGTVFYFASPLIYSLPFSGYDWEFREVAFERIAIRVVFALTTFFVVYTGSSEITQSVSRMVSTSKKSQNLHNMLINLAFPPQIANSLKKFQDVPPKLGLASCIFFQVLNDDDFPTSSLGQIIMKFDQLAFANNVTKVKNIGTIFYGTTGLFDSQTSFGEIIARSFIFSLQCAEYLKQHHPDVRFSAGLSSGVILHGILGSNKFQWDVWGSPVNLAARIQSLGVTNQILCDAETRSIFHKYIVADRNVEKPHIYGTKLIDLVPFRTIEVPSIDQSTFHNIVKSISSFGTNKRGLSSLNEKCIESDQTTFSLIDLYSLKLKNHTIQQHKSFFDNIDKTLDSPNPHVSPLLSPLVSNTDPIFSSSTTSSIKQITESSSELEHISYESLGLGLGTSVFSSENYSDDTLDLSNSLYSQIFSIPLQKKKVFKIKKTSPKPSLSIRPQAPDNHSTIRKFQKSFVGNKISSENFHNHMFEEDLVKKMIPYVRIARWPLYSFLHYTVPNVAIPTPKHNFQKLSPQVNLLTNLVWMAHDTLEHTWWTFSIPHFIISLAIFSFQYFLCYKYAKNGKHPILIGASFLFATYIHCLSLSFHLPTVGRFMFLVLLPYPIYMLDYFSKTWSFVVAGTHMILIAFSIALFPDKTLSLRQSVFFIFLCGSFLAATTWHRVLYVELVECHKMKSSAYTFSLLDRMFPQPIIESIRTGASRQDLSQKFSYATWIDFDIVNFTAFCQVSSPQEILSHLSAIFDIFDSESQKMGIEKIKTLGDAWHGICGVFDKLDRKEQSLKMIQFGKSCLARLEKYCQISNSDFHCRVVIHSGPVESGVLGFDRISYDIWGQSSKTLTNLENFASPDRILISEAACQYIDSSLYHTEPVQMTNRKCCNQSIINSLPVCFLVK